MKKIGEIVEKIIREINDKKHQLKEKVFNAYEWDGILEAIEFEFGETISLYHATTEEISKIIDEEGFKFTYGKNYKSFQREEIIYFQIGKSDYRSDERSVVYKIDVPVGFLGIAEVDVDTAYVKDEDIYKHIPEEEYDLKDSDTRDAIMYFIWNGMTFYGMELLF